MYTCFPRSLLIRHGTIRCLGLDNSGVTLFFRSRYRVYPGNGSGIPREAILQPTSRRAFQNTLSYLPRICCRLDPPESQHQHLPADSSSYGDGDSGNSETSDSGGNGPWARDLLYLTALWRLRRSCQPRAPSDEGRGGQGGGDGGGLARARL